MTAAAGGTGCAAVQAAVALGADVVAAVGSAEKLDLPRSLGAAEAVTYGQLSEVAPVDVVYDLVGGDLFASSVKMLRPLGSRSGRLRGWLVAAGRSRPGSWDATSASTASTSAG